MALDYGLDSAVAPLERCCRAGLAAMPEAEKSTATLFYSTSERTRNIQSRHRERAKELAKEGRGVSAPERRAKAKEKCES